MPTGGRHILLLLAVLVISGGRAQAQVSVGDEVNMNMNGSLTFGYTGTNGNNVESSHELDFGGQADLTGTYHDPRFLSFNIVPYYNESRANSDVQSAFNSTGILSSANIFSGSKTPGFVSFSKDYNTESELGIPGTTAYKTKGNDQNFNLNWSLLQPRWPTLTAGFGTGSSEYEILGTTGQGTTAVRNWSLRSNYQIFGFILSGGYNHYTISSYLPLIESLTPPIKNTSAVNSYQVVASRRLGTKSSMNLNASRDDSGVEYNSNARNNISVDTFTGTATTNPVRPVTLAFNAGYTDNLEGSLLQSVVPVGGVALPILPPESSHSLDLLGTASYTIQREYTFVAQTSVEHRSQSLEGFNYQSDIYRGSADFSHGLLGGTFGANASLFRFTLSTSSGAASLGSSGGLSYARRLGLWSASGSFRYSQDEQTAIASFTQSGYGFSGSLSRQLKGWQWFSTGSVNKFNFTDGSHTGSSTESVSTTLSSRIINITGNYSQSSGDSLLTASGLIPVTGPILPPSILVTYGGTAYGGAVGLRPLRGLSLTGTYLHSKYNTVNQGTGVGNMVEEYDFKGDYYFRKLHFLAGYTHLDQGVGLAVPYKFNLFYVGVMRTIRFF